ncbi:CBS domain-containing protein [Candidatus Pacearchaeota archaeon]|nr:CBS domain-containing protein [Candidatus Pacearchaeota archaeon]
MHKEIIKCDSNASITEVAKLIKDHEVRHVYVLENGKLAGVVGGIDINNKVVAEGKNCQDIKAKDIMNKVESVKEKEEIEHAYVIMRNYNTFICPVVNEDNELLGYYKFAEVCEEIDNKIHR